MTHHMTHTAGIQKIAVRKESVPALVAELSEKRTEAKLAKKWGEADSLRDEILALGFIVKDVKGGGVEISKSM